MGISTAMRASGPRFRDAASQERVRDLVLRAYDESRGHPGVCAPCSEIATFMMSCSGSEPSSQIFIVAPKGR